ncbi:MAG: Fic family protein [Candidatus Aenigmarchaeota archaeon]|nr:Fic family protein [Candidatus Aenigmarchaeota archaeon]
MSYKPNEPYNELALLPPDLAKFESIEIYKKLSEARAALAELKGRLPIIPNPAMLINTLVLQEAKASSEIENILTTTDKLFRAFTSNITNIDPATKEVLNYRKALWTAFKSNEIYDQNWIINIFKKVTQKDEGIRDVQVYIGNPFQTVYTPPQPEIVNEKLANWLDFFNQSNTIDPLIKMALLHYQFEAIHPFSDGNGRTGRILNVIYLTKQNLIDIPVLYLSKHILEFKNDYYRLLNEVTEKQNWHDWILFNLETVYRTSIYSLEKVNAIYELFNKVKTEIQEKAKEIYSYELLEILFSHVYCKIKILVDQNVASRNTASKYLNKLVALQILEIKREGKETLFLNKRLYEILSK